MLDIVERLRWNDGRMGALHEEAAKEIERLRVEVLALRERLEAEDPGVIRIAKGGEEHLKIKPVGNVGIGSGPNRGTLEPNNLLWVCDGPVTISSPAPIHNWCVVGRDGKTVLEIDVTGQLTGDVETAIGICQESYSPEFVPPLLALRALQQEIARLRGRVAELEAALCRWECVTQVIGTHRSCMCKECMKLIKLAEEAREGRAVSE